MARGSPARLGAHPHHPNPRDAKALALPRRNLRPPHPSHPEHVEALFGKGHQLTKHADLSQPGQFACKEQLTIVGPKGKIERVRVLGPTRKYSQVEIALTEQYKLGIHPPVSQSVDIKDSPGCNLEAQAGKLELDKGLNSAMRHFQMTPADAQLYGVRGQVRLSRARRGRSRTDFRRRARARRPELRPRDAHRHRRGQRRPCDGQRPGSHRIDPKLNVPGHPGDFLPRNSNPGS